MMSRFTRLTSEDLLKDEVILASTYGSWRAETKSITIFVLSLIVSIALIIYSFTLKDAGVFVYAVYFLAGVLLLTALMTLLGLASEHYGTHYFLTNFRVIKRSGILSKKMDYVLYSKIQNVKVNKNIAERILDIGDIYIDVAGSPNVEMILENVSDPEKYNKIILEKIKETQSGGL